MRWKVWAPASLVLALTRIASADGPPVSTAGAACQSADECPLLACVCNDGKTLSTRECFDHVCSPTQKACDTSCENNGGFTGRLADPQSPTPTPAPTPAPAPPPAAAPVPAPAPAAWVCVPNDDAPCAAPATHHVCAADGSGWGACVQGIPFKSGQRANEARSVARWEQVSPGLQTVGTILTIGGVIAMPIGGIVWGTTKKSSSGAPIVVAGGISLVTGIVLHYIGTMYTAKLEPSDRGKAPKTPQASVAPFFGPTEVGLHGAF